MNLTYRGQAYTTSNKVATVSTKIVLTYRGQSYRSSRAVLNVEPDISFALAEEANLVYRGVSYIHSETISLYHLISILS